MHVTCTYIVFRWTAIVSVKCHTNNPFTKRQLDVCKINCNLKCFLKDYIAFVYLPCGWEQQGPAGLSLLGASGTKTPACEIPSPTANWDTRLLFTSGLETTTAGPAASALNTQTTTASQRVSSLKKDTLIFTSTLSVLKTQNWILDFNPFRQTKISLLLRLKFQ